MKKVLLLILLPGFYNCKSQNTTSPTDQLVLKKGQVITAVTTIDMQAAGQSEKKLVSTNLLTILESTDKDYKLSGRIIKITDDEEGAHDYDANKPSPENADFEKHLFVPVMLINKFTARSKPYNIQDSAKAPDANSMDKMTLELLYLNTIDGAFLIIPRGKKTGDSWPVSDSTENSKTNISYLLESLNADSAKISFKGTKTTHRTMEINTLQVDMKTNETLSGEIYLNTRTGMVKRKIMTSDSVGTVEMMGRTTDVNAKTETTISYN